MLCIRATIAFVVVVLAVTAHSAPKGLSELKSGHEALVKQGDNSHEARLKSLADEYARELGRLKEQFRADGDLDALVSCDRELKRFKVDKTVSSLPFAGINEMLRLCQSSYRRRVAKCEFDNATAVITPTRDYMAKLEALKKQFVLKDKLEDALAVRDEIAAADLFLKDAITTAADADAESKRPAPSPVRFTPSDGIVLHCSFDAKEVDRRVIDRSGKGHHGKVCGAHWTAKGKLGGAYEFNGFSSYIELADPGIDSTGDFTISAWIKARQQDDAGVVYAQSDGRKGSDEPIIWLQVVAGRLSSRIRGTNGSDNAGRCRTKLLGGWHHVALSWTSSAGKICYYVDGKLDGSTVGRLSGDTSSNDWFGIGGVFDDLSQVKRFFKGLIDEVMIWPRALSADEILRLYQKQDGK